MKIGRGNQSGNPIRQSGNLLCNNPAMNPANAMRQRYGNPANVYPAIAEYAANVIRQTGKGMVNAAIAGLLKNLDFIGLYLAKHFAKHFAKQKCFASAMFLEKHCTKNPKFTNVSRFTNHFYQNFECFAIYKTREKGNVQCFAIYRDSERHYESFPLLKAHARERESFTSHQKNPRLVNRETF